MSITVKHIESGQTITLLLNEASINFSLGDRHSVAENNPGTATIKVPCISSYTFNPSVGKTTDANKALISGFTSIDIRAGKNGLNEAGEGESSTLYSRLKVNRSANGIKVYVPEFSTPYTGAIDPVDARKDGDTYFDSNLKFTWVQQDGEWVRIRRPRISVGSITDVSASASWSGNGGISEPVELKKVSDLTLTEYSQSSPISLTGLTSDSTYRIYFTAEPNNYTEFKTLVTPPPTPSYILGDWKLLNMVDIAPLISLDNEPVAIDGEIASSVIRFEWERRFRASVDGKLIEYCDDYLNGVLIGTATWTSVSVNNDLETLLISDVILLEPTGHSGTYVCYATAKNSGVTTRYKSLDYGITWAVSTDELTAENPLPILHIITTIRGNETNYAAPWDGTFPDGMYGTALNQVFKTDNISPDAITWEKITVETLAPSTMIDGLLLVGAYVREYKDKFVYLTIDILYGGSYYPNGEFEPSFGNFIGYVYRSADHGLHWSRYNDSGYIPPVEIDRAIWARTPNKATTRQIVDTSPDVERWYYIWEHDVYWNDDLVPFATTGGETPAPVWTNHANIVTLPADVEGVFLAPVCAPDPENPLGTLYAILKNSYTVKTMGAEGGFMEYRLPRNHRFYTSTNQGSTWTEYKFGTDSEPVYHPETDPGISGDAYWSIADTNENRGVFQYIGVANGSVFASRNGTGTKNYQLGELGWYESNPNTSPVLYNHVASYCDGVATIWASSGADLWNSTTNEAGIINYWANVGTLPSQTPPFDQIAGTFIVWIGVINASAVPTILVCNLDAGIYSTLDGATYTDISDGLRGKFAFDGVTATEFLASGLDIYCYAGYSSNDWGTGHIYKNTLIEI